MDKKNTSKIIFRVLSIMVFSLVVCFLLTSIIYARYISSDGNTNAARVARWEIDFGDKTSYNSIVSSTHLESGSSGEWGLDISNKSEVLAKFADDSNIRIRLQSPDFHIDHMHDSWDFLEDNEHNKIDNPINFKAYMYNCSLAELAALNGNLTGVNVVELFDTKNHPDVLEFEMVINNGELYFECVVNFGEKLNVSDDFLLDIGEGKACLKIFWKVEEMLDSVSTNDTFKSYFLVESSQYNTTKYDGKLEDIITIDAVQYVIAYKFYDYFEYLIYTSSLGGEIMITFTDSLGKNYIRRCTKLSDAEENILLARNLSTSRTLDEVNGYIELLEYQEFKEFMQMKSDYNETTGYLSLGLECRIILDLKVEQVD